MPEIAEGKLVHFLRQHLVGKTIAKVQALDDNNVFGKVGCSGPAFEKALKGRTVREAGSQGKYFWLVMDKSPHPVMHLGMTGWIHIQNDRTAYTNYYKKMKPEEQEAWPPKYWKFEIETEGKTPVRVAFTDPRRFGRVRLVDCPGDEIRKASPLVENGPDPVVDKGIFTEEYLRTKMKSRHVPLKAFILDQTVISGIGNWVADESLYHARLHPEQYCDEFSDKETERLHEAITYVCQTACDLLADSDQFPDHWLFNHRWGKGKKTASALPNGEKLAFLTVGGRTSCYAPAIQKKTGHVAPGIKEEVLEIGDADEKPKKAKARKPRSQEPEDDADEKAPKKARARKSQPHESDGEEQRPLKRTKGKQEDVKNERKPSVSQSAKKTNGTVAKTEEETGPGRRRSTRLSKGS
ncbi:Formamidopyrimidine-DNA glycosylase [Cytospora mali]|uniref:Formamidopyrimidine-DNA glycosylase n=1 Tax=Cytospora mali TaxID=578113 RepID=A0A194UMW9_CYTMA|nr:Formamidopyrimidine-DNA glycosylase [Valsa mali var. pyri (nom. inval.)]